MRVLTLLWKHRLVLLLSLIVSAVVAAPFALRLQPTYTSNAELFLPAADPVARIVSDTSAISLQLQGYAGGELRGDVGAAAGADAGKIVSLEAELDPNESDVYQLTAQAETPAMARTTIELSATAMRTEAIDLLGEQFALFREKITEDVLIAYRGKRRVIGLIPDQKALVDGIASELEGLDESSSEAEALANDLERERNLLNTYRQQQLILLQEQKHLINLPATVGEQVAVAQGVARVVSGPSNPAADTQIRVVQLVGAAVMAGVLAAVLLTLWLERAALWGDSVKGSPSPRLAEVIRSDPGPDPSQGGSPRTLERER